MVSGLTLYKSSKSGRKAGVRCLKKPARATPLIVARCTAVSMRGEAYSSGRIFPLAPATAYYQINSGLRTFYAG